MFQEFIDRTGIVGSKPARGMMYVHVHMCCGRLAMSRSPVRGNLPSV